MQDHPLMLIKAGGDIAAGGIVVATLMSWLPPIAAGLSIIWLGLQIYWGIRDRTKRRK